MPAARASKLGVLWDTLHTHRHGESAEYTWAQLGDRIRLVHVKDSVTATPQGLRLCAHRRGNGSGHVVHRGARAGAAMTASSTSSGRRAGTRKSPSRRWRSPISRASWPEGCSGCSGRDPMARGAAKAHPAASSRFAAWRERRRSVAMQKWGPGYVLVFPAIVLIALMMVYPVIQTLHFSVSKVQLPSFDTTLSASQTSPESTTTPRRGRSSFARSPGSSARSCSEWCSASAPP